MKTLPLIAIIILSMLSYSCLHSKNDQEKMNNNLMEADMAFSALAEEKGINEAFLSFCADDAVMLRKNSLPIVGKSAISAWFTKPDSSFVMKWQPIHSSVAKSGELGYTFGLYEFYLKINPDSVEKGTYVSVWKKDKHGDWKWLLDSGNEGIE